MTRLSYSITEAVEAGIGPHYDQRYQLRDIPQADLISDESVGIGVATEANIDHDGDLTVCRRRGDATAVYTYSPAVGGESEDGDLPALWNRWESVD